MLTKQITFSIDQLRDVARVIYDQCMRSGCRVVGLTGPLGAGKTTLTRALLRHAGVQDEVITSPTFTYVNVYRTKHQTFYHFDLYRLTSIDDFMLQGFDEYVDDLESICFIEWPEIIEPLLTMRDDVCMFKLIHTNDTQRTLIVEDNDDERE